MLRSSGITLVAVGLVLLFIVRRLVGWLPLIGGTLSGTALICGLLAVGGGGYLMVRRLKAIGTGD